MSNNIVTTASNLVQTTSGKLVYYEYFTGGPYNIANNGDKIEVTPSISAA